VPERFDRGPLLLGVRLGHARRLVNSAHRHLEVKLGLALVDGAGYRGGALRIGRAGQRDMAFAGQQAGGRIKADPAGAGEIDFAPGVQIRKILLGTARAIQRLHVRLELDDVAGDKARGEPDAPQELAEKPRGVAARAAAGFERLLGRLHARFHPDQIFDVVRDPLIDRHHEVDRARARIHGAFRHELQRLG